METAIDPSLAPNPLRIGRAPVSPDLIQARPADARLFPGVEEAINLGLPFLFIAMSVYEVASGRPPVDESSWQFWTIFARIFLLNHVHVFFTFFILIAIPEGREWARAKMTKSRSLALFLGGLLGFLALFPLMQHGRELGAWGVFALALLLRYRLYHVFYQDYGLSRFYLRLGDAGRASPRLDFLERWLMHTLAILVIGGAVVLRVIGWSPLLRGSILWLGLALAAAILGVSYRIDRRLSRRVLFQVRYFIYPFMHLSYFALFGSMALHGLGYLFVVRKYVRNAGFHQSFAAWAFVACIIAGLSLLEPIQYRAMRPWIAGSYLGNTTFLFCASLLSYLAGYLHFYVDGFLFRGRDADSRRWILRFLVMPEA